MSKSGENSSVIGGTYLEHCIEPHHKELYGSGLRGAINLAANGVKTELHTFISNDYAALLSSIAENYEIKLNAYESDNTIRFDYYHALSPPAFDFAPIKGQRGKEIELELNNALVYATLEPRPKIHANKIVYDPQSGDPEHFSRNGSTSNETAIILNEYEASRLTGNSNYIEAAKLLLSDEYSIAIIKRGPWGLYIATETESDKHIPAYESEVVFKIGSGDIFSSSFFFFWVIKNRPPIEAADLASKCVSDYVNHGSPAFEFDSVATLTPLPVKSSKPKVYLAGPFFSIHERWLIEESRCALSHMGMDVFSPYHDVGILGPKESAQADLNGLNESNAVLALMDNNDPGTIFEIGHARSRNIPVVILSEKIEERDSVMFLGTESIIVEDFVTAIYRSVWEAIKNAS